MKKAKIAIVTLGHYIYFQQFEKLREELMTKSDALVKHLQSHACDIVNAGYIDCVEDAFGAVRHLKKEDVDLLFILLSTYVPSSVCAPFARYLDVPQILVGIQPLDHLNYAHTTTYMQLANDDICAMPEVAGVYERLGRDVPPLHRRCIQANRTHSTADR